MKPTAHSGGESKEVKKGFNHDVFAEAVKLRYGLTVTNVMPVGLAKRMGFIHHRNGRPIRFPGNPHYMAGYNSYEPLIVTRRLAGKRPQYALADIDYQTELTGLPEWFNSPSEAIYYARAVGVPLSRMGFGWRIIEYHQKNETFEQKVDKDSLIKADVPRLYQSTITGELSTSIDHGKTWFDGGIMDCPLIPMVSIIELHGGGYRAVGTGWHFDYHYVTRTIPELNELKSGSFKLKPPRPVPPKFDAIDWLNDEFSWWKWHMDNSFDCRMSHGHYDSSHKEEDESDENDVPRHHTRCDCYHEKISEYEKAVKKYEIALEKWAKL